MAWHERDYNREEQHTSGGFGRNFSTRTVVTWLIIINAVIFLLDAILTGSQRASWLSPYIHGAFDVGRAVHGWQLWRWFTYQFLHGDFFHVFFNMLGLYFFGPMIENYLGSRRFLAFYLLCGMSGAVLYSLIVSFAPGLIFPDMIVRVAGQVPLIGASGSVFGVLIAAACVAPRQRVMLLFPPIPMELRTMAMVFLGIATLSLLAGSSNAGGDACHLGGAALGYLFIKRTWLLNWADRLGGDGWRRWKEKRRSRKVSREREESVAMEAEVDRILAKVKDHGLHSLTEGENKSLQRATENKRKAG
ncbi:MAG: rhomboid family intramembrane serine protease [Phycisphaeraceae bacterium]